MSQNKYKTRAQFQSQTPLEKRQKEFNLVLAKYPDKVIVYVDTDDKNALELNKNKFIVPANLAFLEFKKCVRKHIKALSPNEALNAFIITKKSQIMATPSKTMSELYNEYKDDDECLYITFLGENVFG